MIPTWWLIWIIPLSAILGMLCMMLAVAAGRDRDDDDERS